MVNKDELKKQVLLEDMPQQGLEKLAKIIQKLSLKKGESLFKEEDDTKGIYMIQSGKIEINKVTPDGWKQSLAHFTTGNFFGELSILEKRRHEANATAMEDTELLMLSRADFEKMEKEDLELASKIVKKIAMVMSRDLRRMNDKFINALINY